MLIVELQEAPRVLGPSRRSWTERRGAGGGPPGCPGAALTFLLVLLCSGEKKGRSLLAGRPGPPGRERDQGPRPEGGQKRRRP